MDCQQISLVGQGGHGSLLHLCLEDKFPIRQAYLDQELNLKLDPRRRKKQNKTPKHNKISFKLLIFLATTINQSGIKTESKHLQQLSICVWKKPSTWSSSDKLCLRIKAFIYSLWRSVPLQSIQFSLMPKIFFFPNFFPVTVKISGLLKHEHNSKTQGLIKTGESVNYFKFEIPSGDWVTMSH